MLTNQQLMHEQVRLQDQIRDVCQAIATMQAIHRKALQQLEAVSVEQKRRSHGKAGPIDESNLDDVVRRAEAGELAMRVDVADIDGETA